MYKLAYNDDLTFNGFYKEGINKEIPSKNLNIDTSLWSYLLGLSEFKIKKDVDLSKKIYTLEDVDLFEVVVQEQPKSDNLDIGMSQIRNLEEKIIKMQEAIDFLVMGGAQ